MRRIVFYSWQSDLPNATNRGFVQRALERAAEEIASDDEVEVEPVVDRDTQGVPGAPDIASTILAKISGADVFVADVSLIGQVAEGRFVPNPNVLIELGYALRGLGHERVILVFNEEYGDVRNLPFDLRMRRVLTYRAASGEEDRSEARAGLVSALNTALRSAFEQTPAGDEEEGGSAAISAIEEQAANRVLVVRRELDEILERLVELEPTKPRDGGSAEELLAALDESQEPVARFSKLAEVVAVLDDRRIAVEICRWLGNVLDRYNLPRGFNGRYDDGDQDYFRFVGHEMFVTLIALLLRERQWDAIREVLSQEIPVRNAPNQDGPATAGWHELSQYLYLVAEEAKNRRRVSLHADLLHQRHEEGGLSGVMPYEDFAAAELLLFLWVEMPPEKNERGRFTWRPWSLLYLHHTPLFLKETRSLARAQNLMGCFAIEDVDTFRNRLQVRLPLAGRLFDRGLAMREFWYDFDFTQIGSRP